METHGSFAPTTEAEAAERYASLAPTAKTVVREVAKAMSFDREEYADRVTPDVVATARDALFAESLVVHTGSREAFDAWLDDAEVFDEDGDENEDGGGDGDGDGDGDVEVELLGSEHVERVAWHPVAFAGVVVAATYQDEENAAVSTLRRQAFGRHYRDVVE